MRKITLVLIILGVGLGSLCAQFEHTVTYQPGGSEGKDADLFSAPEWMDQNFGNEPWFRAESWTRFGELNLVRGLIYFPIKDLLADADTVVNATITIYRDYNYPYSEGGTHGDNASRLYVVTGEWDENTITWNTQPSYNETVFVDIPTNNDYDSIEIDLTTLINDCINNQLPYYGFILRNSVEETYKSLNFFSSDGEDPARRPKIRLTYTSSISCGWSKLNSTVFYTEGNVAIGTIDANGYKLAVNGTIFSREVVINPQGWPDYVFSDDYKLLSLTQLQEYINQHQHLPGIPSQKEVEDNGVELGHINKKLLQKVEELTLYILQQDSKLKELEQRLSDVEER